MNLSNIGREEKELCSRGRDVQRMKIIPGREKGDEPVVDRRERYRRVDSKRVVKREVQQELRLVHCFASFCD